MDFPKISIIIPVYNNEKYLSKCLDSCVNQTMQHIEIICVDDCSTDASYKVLMKYRKIDSRIKVLRQEKNNKQGAARNKGLKIAKGEYVWFVDSDDYIDVNACQILYDIIKKINVDLLMFCAMRFVEKDTNVVFSFDKYCYQRIQINKIYSKETYPKGLNFSHLNVIPCAFLTKRLVLQKFEFREGVFFEDIDFTPILLASVDSFCFIPYTAYFYRINPISMTNSHMSQKKIEDFIQALGSLHKFIVDNKVVDEHFLYNFLVCQVTYISMRCLEQNITPNNFEILCNLRRYIKDKSFPQQI